MDPLAASIKAAASGLSVQSTRMRVLSENLANVDSTSNIPGGDPYTRKTISFQAAIDEASGADVVEVKEIGLKKSPFRTEYNPSHPAADEKGFVKYPNVDEMVELADMREATRSYNANIQMIKQVREMITQTVDLLRS